jgi:hypothetical protein
MVKAIAKEDNFMNKHNDFTRYKGRVFHVKKSSLKNGFVKT